MSNTPTMPINAMKATKNKALTKNTILKQIFVETVYNQKNSYV